MAAAVQRVPQGGRFCLLQPSICSQHDSANFLKHSFSMVTTLWLSLSFTSAPAQVIADFQKFCTPQVNWARAPCICLSLHHSDVTTKFCGFCHWSSRSHQRTGDEVGIVRFPKAYMNTLSSFWLILLIHLLEPSTSTYRLHRNNPEGYTALQAGRAGRRIGEVPSVLGRGLPGPVAG